MTASRQMWPRLAILLMILTLARSEYRSYNGVGNNVKYPNAGAAFTPFLRDSNPFFSSAGDMIPSPDTAGLPTSCASPLAAGSWPLGRCVSNVAMSYSTSTKDYAALQSFTSSTLRTHMITMFGHFLSFDLTASSGRAPEIQIPMPSDDSQFQSPGSSPLNGSLPFAATLPVASNITSTTGSPVRTGLNMVTSFLDGSSIYGSSLEEVNRLREPQTCRMRVSLDSKGHAYPPRNAVTRLYDLGFYSRRSGDIFSTMISTMFLREHNDYCRNLTLSNPSMDSDTAFEETRAYVVALLQHITYTEYLGNVLGVPPPPYEGYMPEIIPGIDTLWATSTFRYGHSEIGDSYPILDRHNQLVRVLSFQETRDLVDLEMFGFENIARLCARQVQEEVDIYYSDQTRNFKTHDGTPVDLAQLDILRGRDHGLPLYNEARKKFRLKPATTWSDISSNVKVQDALKRLYGTIDRVEMTVGALSEDHMPGSSLGELFWTSMMVQFTAIRDSDRFWYQSEGILKSDVLKTVQSTRMRTLLLRHFKDNSTLPANIWSYAPETDHTVSATSKGVEFTPDYKVNWVNNIGSIEFTLTFRGEVGWLGFGIGPNPNMGGAQFFVVEHENEQSTQLVLRRYASTGDQVPPRRVAQLGNVDRPEGAQPLVVKFSRTLSEEDGVAITDKNINILYAYSTNKVLMYHLAGESHGFHETNFFNYFDSGDMSNSPRTTHKWHGIGMFLCWAVVFPASIFLVRYQKHRIENAISIHKHIQLLTGFSITSLAAAAISTASPGLHKEHKVMGLTILAAVIGQLGLGIVAIYTLGQLETANKGLARIIKGAHRILGTGVLLLAWVNIYYGLVAYRAPRSYIYAYFAYLGLLVLSVSVYHYRWQVAGTTTKGTRRVLVQDFLPESPKNTTNWPKITWDDINARVNGGAKLVVVDDYVFDIRDWISSHPGGAKVLDRVIGTDITADFYGHSTMGAMDQEDAEPTDSTELRQMRTNHSTRSASISSAASHTLLGSLQPYKMTTNLPKVLETFRDMPRASRRISTNSRFMLMERDVQDLGATKNLTLFDQIMEKIRQFSHWVDRLNIRLGGGTASFGSEGKTSRVLATHHHTARAISRLAKYCIGVIDLEKSSWQALRRSTTQQSNPTRRIFKRYLLNSKTTLTNPLSSRPVRRFTFKPCIEDSSHASTARQPFLPGEYVEIQCAVDGQVLTRCYTPVEGNMADEFSIYIKIYSDGMVSRFLDMQHPGSEVRLRGVFDLGEKYGLVAKGDDEGSIPRLLINPSRPDGCWSLLLMVAGGSGITPMLQLIHHHIRNQKEDTRCEMFLLFLNSSQRDVIAGQHLDELERLSEGRLRIHYGINETTEATPNVFKGHLDESTLKQWFTRVSVIRSGEIGGLGQNLSQMEDGVGFVDESDFAVRSVVNTFVRPGVRVVVSGPPGMMDTTLSFMEKFRFPLERTVVMH